MQKQGEKNLKNLPDKPLQKDVTKTKNDLAGYLTARAKVSSYVAGVKYASLPDIEFEKLPQDIQVKLPADPQKVLDQVKANLAIAQKNALCWSNDIEPDLTAIPQAIINFNEKFKVSSTDISQWLGELASGNTANKENLQETLLWLIGVINDQQTNIQAEMTLIKKFNTQLTADHANFSASNGSFAELYTFEEASIKNLQNAISGLKDALKAEDKAITASGIAAGVGGGLMVAGGIGLASAETGVGLVVAGICIIVGLAAAIAGIVELVKAINAKVKTQTELNVDEAAVSILSVQAAVLLSVDDALKELVELAESAMAAVQVILDTWGTLAVKIQAVHDGLKNADGKDFGKITAVFDIGAAITQWSELTDFAGKMQTYVATNFQKVSDLGEGGKIQPLSYGKDNPKVA
ncbi:MAG: HBL/NHE enterotoxin family protein [Halioglobus sp.]